MQICGGEQTLFCLSGDSKVRVFAYDLNTFCFMADQNDILCCEIVMWNARKKKDRLNDRLNRLYCELLKILKNQLDPNLVGQL